LFSVQHVGLRSSDAKVQSRLLRRNMSQI
jgi:hypothetical protein